MSKDIIVELKEVVQWLSYQSVALTKGIKCKLDAVKLYDFWMKNQKELPLYADNSKDILQKAGRKKALGYDPLEK